MQGSLKLHSGVLYVGWHALTAEVASFDLDGRPLETRFRFKDESAGRSSVDGIDMDGDHRLWVADAAARRVRCFTLFGQEVASVGDEDLAGPERDAHGFIGTPVDVRVSGTDDDQVLLVASTGDRRHGLQVLHLATGRGRSIAPMGDPEGRFRRIRSLDYRAGELVVCEASARRVQVFEGDPAGRFRFRFAFPVDPALGVPEAVAVVGDGRIVVATRGDTSGLFVFDGAGRLKATLAGSGDRVGRGEFGVEVDQPSALAIEPSLSDRYTRVCVLDREGERVQIFSLDGRSFGSFVDFGIGH